jgi:hypothetical protein
MNRLACPVACCRSGVAQTCETKENDWEGGEIFLNYHACYFNLSVVKYFQTNKSQY